jgi:hypothetical protein
MVDKDEQFDKLDEIIRNLPRNFRQQFDEMKKLNLEYMEFNLHAINLILDSLKPDYSAYRDIEMRKTQLKKKIAEISDKKF